MIQTESWSAISLGSLEATTTYRNKIPSTITDMFYLRHQWPNHPRNHMIEELPYTQPEAWVLALKRITSDSIGILLTSVSFILYITVGLSDSNSGITISAYSTGSIAISSRALGFYRHFWQQQQERERVRSSRVRGGAPSIGARRDADSLWYLWWPWLQTTCNKEIPSVVLRLLIR